TDGAKSSRVSIPLYDDPIRAVRQSHLVDTAIESGPLEDLREKEIPQPLPSALSLVPPSDDPYFIVRQTHTLAIIDTSLSQRRLPQRQGSLRLLSHQILGSPHHTSQLYKIPPHRYYKTLCALLQTNSKREIIFYTSSEDIWLTKFCQQEVKPILHKLHLNFEIFQKRF
ncbi:hypothetical protein Tco_1172175, partial [Tanacetum coccineum]